MNSNTLNTIKYSDLLLTVSALLQFSVICLHSHYHLVVLQGEDAIV